MTRGGGRKCAGLFLARLFCLRPQLTAPALAAPGGAHCVPGVALHADHLVQTAALGLREAGHMEDEGRVV